jgi:hypothetical protein
MRDAGSLAAHGARLVVKNCLQEMAEITTIPTRITFRREPFTSLYFITHTSFLQTEIEAVRGKLL